MNYNPIRSAARIELQGEAQQVGICAASLPHARFDALCGLDAEHAGAHRAYFDRQDGEVFVQWPLSLTAANVDPDAAAVEAASSIRPERRGDRRADFRRRVARHSRQRLPRHDLPDERHGRELLAARETIAKRDATLARVAIIERDLSEQGEMQAMRESYYAVTRGAALRDAAACIRLALTAPEPARG